MRVFTLGAIAFMFVGQLAHAWSDGGHKTVAAIAFRRLSAQEQSKIVELLKNHPRFAEDFQNLVPGNVHASQLNEWYFQQAAIWPDLARGFRGDLHTTYHRPSWHYTNLPTFLTTADMTALHAHLTANTSFDLPAGTTVDSMDLNVIQAIKFAQKTLSQSTATPEEKGLMLAWLFHMVGDSHQPLHSAALYSRRLFPNGDRGGNAIKTEQQGELHAVWDRFLGGKVQFRTVSHQAIELLADPDMQTVGSAAAASLSVDDWINESFDLANSTAYGPEVMAQLRHLESGQIDIDSHPLNLSDDYLSEGRKAADIRVVQAGYRLAAILKTLAATLP